MAQSQETRAAIRLAGLDRVIRKFDFSKDALEVMTKAVESAADIVLGESRRRAPVDVGTLRASINRQTKLEDQTVVVNIGSNLQKDGKPYPAFMEFGTGRVNDHPSWPKVAVQVPAAALVAWAARKSRGGTTRGAFAIAAAINRRGGLMPRRYLRGSLEMYENEVLVRLSRVISELRRARGL